MSKGLTQTEVLDAFVAIAREDNDFPFDRMVQVVTAFAEKISLTPAELSRIIGARDIEIHGTPLLYKGELPAEEAVT
ncbi:hypothetical protein LCGC14_2409330 [marine sediment metagenome]|uniref:Uncharacterized protein n=1 Tax=marine sediment metagenome TaxID=412755 RepID=A0A0F9EMD8_9ZZZZ